MANQVEVAALLQACTAISRLPGKLMADLWVLMNYFSH